MEEMMDQSPENALRNRAAAADGRRRLEERLKQKEREEERSQEARRLISKLFQVDLPAPGSSQLPVEVDALLFDVGREEGDWFLVYLASCCDDQCDRFKSFPIHSLADLGDALEEGPQYCERCGG